MSSGGEYRRDPALTPQMARAIAQMKARAHRIRSHRMWTMLGFIVVFQFIGAAVVVRGLLPWAAPEHVFGASVFVAALLGQAVHLWRVRGLHPRCPNCRGEWRIRDQQNEEIFGVFGNCPHCGIPV